MLFGVIFAVVGICAALGLRAPRPEDIRGLEARAKIAVSPRDYTPGRDAENAGVLVDVFDDDHDVHRRVDGGVAVLAR